MKHRLPFEDVAFYETAIVDILQEYLPFLPLSVSITIHEAGKGGGTYSSREAWPPGTRSVPDIANFVAQKIVQAYKAQGGVFDGVTIHLNIA